MKTILNNLENSNENVLLIIVNFLELPHVNFLVVFQYFERISSRLGSFLCNFQMNLFSFFLLLFISLSLLSFFLDSCNSLKTFSRKSTSMLKFL